MKVDSKKDPATGNPRRRRGTYNPACDVCARKKIKCDGNKPVCQPCQSQGRQKECTWTKNPVRKPRTEAYFEAMHKQAEILRQRLAEFRHYADHLESLLAECQQYHKQHRTIEFLSSRPSDSETLLDVPEPDSDFHDQASDDGNDPAVMAICIPPQSLQVEEGGRTLHLGNATPFRFAEPFTQPSRFLALAENPDDTCVLLVEGVESSHYNPTFDWSRHLPSAVPLDRRSHDKALDLLFKFFTSWCLRIVPALFLRDMYRALSAPPSQTPPITPHYSPMLHNALVALALAFLDEPRFTDLKSRQYFANAAKSFIEAECRKPNLSVVNALSILASFHSSQGDQTLGYMYFGMSARMSQALGLDMDCSEWVKLGLMDEADRLDRHWAHWSIFTQDACWSLYVGRDFCVPVPIPIDPDTPKTISTSHIDPESDEMPWFYSPAGIAPQPNDLTKTFEATCRLLIIARRIMDVVKGLNKARIRPLVLDALISDIDVQLNMWRDSLTAELEITPPTATPHKLMLHLAYWWLFILLHRPFFHRKSRTIHSTDREIDHVKLCRRAAGNIMDLLLTWRNLYTLRYCPITLIQTVFSAGTVYLLTAIQASSGIRIAQKDLEHSLDQEKLVRQYLQEIGLSWKCATNISGILKTLMDEQVRPLLGRGTVPVATAGLRIDAGDEEEENESNLSRSSSSKSSHKCKGSSIMKAKHRQAHPRTKSSGSGHSSLSTSPNHVIISPTSPAQVSSSPTQALSSPAITISHAPLTHAGPSAPIAIPSQRSTSSSSSPSSFPGSQGLQPSTHNSSPIPSPSSSPLFPNYLPSFSGRGFQGYSPSYNYRFSGNDNSNLFSGNGNSSSEDFGTAFGGSQSSFFGYNLQPSSSQPSKNHSAGGYPGMLGGQTLSEAPFVSPFSEGDTHNPHFLYSSQDPFGAGFPNHAPSSSYLGEHVPSSSHSDYDTMDLDSLQWEPHFGS